MVDWTKVFSAYGKKAKCAINNFTDRKWVTCYFFDRLECMTCR